ncbi:CaiB/BaiF CoA-transferase family protein [Rhodococcus jostii]|uniref:CaiB/BaiF CoA-transferase family protein n=1 Tax=Rhodococcus jostii TaxID=132919 RepID=A0ABU4CRL6_RHOJO|nr:CaiB/BaiF CoA-transferase family protein [Rhodococcus jostii]MDV6285835.1 CaiB/BaiF CoA-transferase family protein [Rhodococcus jostii]
MIEQMRVLSFTHFVQGPAATQYLADLGADVITVEPLSGAWERREGSGGIHLEGRSVTFLSVNRNKRSVAIDLKHPDAATALEPLVASADVLLENYRGGALERLGLGYEAVRRINPRIIYASATGWGSRGPMANRPGVDLLVQARTGLASATGTPGDPHAAGTPVVDHHGAALLAMGVLAAYARRLTTGEGTRVEASLLAAGLDLQAESFALYHSGGRRREDLDRHDALACWSIDAPYGIYRLADGASVALAISGAMDDLGAALGSDELEAFDAAARRSRRQEYTELLVGVLGTLTYQEVEQRLAPAGFWFERVADYDDVLTDPQVVAEDLVARMPVGDTHARVLRHPVRYDGARPSVTRQPAELGGHTREVLREVGLAEDRIDALFASGVVAEPQTAKVDS